MGEGRGVDLPAKKHVWPTSRSGGEIQPLLILSQYVNGVCGQHGCVCVRGGGGNTQTASLGPGGMIHMRHMGKPPASR